MYVTLFFMYLKLHLSLYLLRRTVPYFWQTCLDGNHIYHRYRIFSFLTPESPCEIPSPCLMYFKIGLTVPNQTAWNLDVAVEELRIAIGGPFHRFLPPSTRMATETPVDFPNFNPHPLRFSLRFCTFARAYVYSHVHTPLVRICTPSHAYVRPSAPMNTRRP